MSVFTPVSIEQLAPWLTPYRVGSLQSSRGIRGGSVNTNYWLETDAGAWILSLIEDRNAAAVAPVMQLMQTLSERGLPVPQVRANAQGERVGQLLDRPATLVQALPGEHPLPTASVARQAGAFLAQLHQQHLDLPALPMNFDWAWQQAEVGRWQSVLSVDDAQLMSRAVAVIAPVWCLEHPCAWVHGDLFLDNVLVHEGQLSAVIDWYFASRGPCLWDLAITLNAWCGSKTPANCPVAEALWAGYCTYRKPSEAEVAALGAMRCSAALRFWLSRLGAQERARATLKKQAIMVKSPDEYRLLLLELLTSLS